MYSKVSKYSCILHCNGLLITLFVLISDEFRSERFSIRFEHFFLIYIRCIIFIHRKQQQRFGIKVINMKNCQKLQFEITQKGSTAEKKFLRKYCYPCVHVI